MANRYWVGGSGQWSTSNTANWAATSGGAGGVSVPTSADNAIFDSNSATSSASVLINASSVCLNLSISNSFITINTGTSPALSVYGNLTISTLITWNLNTQISMLSTTTGNTIQTSGTSITGGLFFNGTGGAWQLQDAMTAPGTFTLAAGSLDLNSKTLSVLTFNSNSSSTRSLLNCATITVTGSGAVCWNMGTVTGFTLSGTPVVSFTYSGATASTVTNGTLTAATAFSFNFTAGTYSLTFGQVVNGGANNVNFTGFAGTWTGPNGMLLYGNLTLSTGMTLTAATGTFTFSATTSQTITNNGKTMDFPITFNGVGGTWALQDALTLGSTRTLTHTNGTINLNGKTLTAGVSYTTAAGTKNITFNGGTLLCAAATTTAFNNAVPTGFTTTAGTGTGTISMTASTAKTFVGGGSTYNCSLSNDGAGALTVSGANTITKVTATAASSSTLITGSNSIGTLANAVSPVTYTLTAGTTQTLTTAFALLGTSGNLVTVNSATAGTQATIAFASGGTGNYLSIKDMAFTPLPATNGSTPYVWWAGANSTNLGNVTGILFAAATTIGYLITSGSSWTVPANFNSASNIVHLIGGGGGGGNGVNSTGHNGGGGGGGGGYTKVTNFSATPGGSVAYVVGSGAAATGNGGATTWNSGAYSAGGGRGGSSSTGNGGAAGVGSTFNGGTGGSYSAAFGAAGAPGTGGGGAAGPNGNGGAGGSITAETTSFNAGAGGGGNGGGTAGQNNFSPSGIAASGGNNSLGSGGGAGVASGTQSGSPGTLGGGGGGGQSATNGSSVGAGGAGSIGIDILNTTGSGGGPGGSASAATSAPASSGINGSGGSGGVCSSAGSTTTGGAGGAGLIFVQYTVTLSNGNMLMFF